MKVVILAGGFGTRISEESAFKPKPMIEIGGMPILWHIMKTYSYYGFNEFVICAGYKQHIIKEWFADYFYIHRMSPLIIQEVEMRLLCIISVRSLGKLQWLIQDLIHRQVEESNELRNILVMKNLCSHTVMR